MKFNSKKLLLIVIISSVTGLIYNHFNPQGIPLNWKGKELIWAGDSLLFEESISEDDSILSPELKAVPNDEQPSLISQHNEEKKSAPIKDVTEQKENQTPEMTEPLAVNLDQAYRLYQQGIVFLDARDNYEFREGHIKNAVSLPYYQFEEFEHQLKNIAKDKAVVTYCGGSDCDLSVMLGNKLFKMGYKRVYIFHGGWNDWTNATYPVTIKQSDE